MLSQTKVIYTQVVVVVYILSFQKDFLRMSVLSSSVMSL